MSNGFRLFPIFVCPFLVTSRCLHPIPESIRRCSRDSVLSTLMFIILCSRFWWQTVSDRFQFSCVHSWSPHGVSIRFRSPSGGVHVTVFYRLMVIILCWFFGCQTVSDRYQFSCVHSWSHQCLPPIPFRYPVFPFFFWSVLCVFLLSFLSVFSFLSVSVHGIRCRR